MDRIKNLDALSPSPGKTGSKPSKAQLPPKEKSSKSGAFRQEVYRLVGEKSRPLSAFLARPRAISFESQLEGEEVILLLRRHWITNVKWLVVLVIMLFAPVLLTWVPLLDSFPVVYRFIFTLFWYLFTFAYFLESFFTWYFNINIITDERIIDIDFYSLVYKEISDAQIEEIQDVTVKQGGFLATLLNYGTVFIQTAAEKPRFEFVDIPNPGLVTKVLQQLRLEERQEELEGRML